MRIRRLTPVLSRSVVGIIALMAMTRGLAAPPCEHHRGGADTQAAQPAAGAPADLTDHAHHGVPAEPHGAQHGSDADLCQCIGDCAAGVTAVTPLPTVGPASIVAPVAVALPQRITTRIAGRTRFALPFSTAPPSPLAQT